MQKIRVLDRNQEVALRILRYKGWTGKLLASEFNIATATVWNYVYPNRRKKYQRKSALCDCCGSETKHHKKCIACRILLHDNPPENIWKITKSYGNYCFSCFPMKIVNEYPPNYAMIRENFPDISSYKPCFCFGGIIYNPFEGQIPEDIIYHESIHSKRQGDNPESWWVRYCLDTAFREEEEIFAYASQLNFIRKFVPKATEEALDEFAAILSSSLYRLGTDYHKIYTKIRLRAKELQ